MIIRRSDRWHASFCGVRSRPKLKPPPTPWPAESKRLAKCSAARFDCSGRPRRRSSNCVASTGITYLLQATESAVVGETIRRAVADFKPDPKDEVEFVIDIDAVNML